MFTQLKTITATLLLSSVLSLSYGSSDADVLGQSKFHGAQTFNVLEDKDILQTIHKNYITGLPTLILQKDALLSAEKTSEKITEYLCQFIPDVYNKTGEKELREKILFLMNAEKPLNIFMRGCPFKSTNHEKKSLGCHVDMGEFLTLATFQTMVENIKPLYSLTSFSILSDGVAFHTDGDPSYEDILTYHKEMALLIKLFPGVQFISMPGSSYLESIESFQKSVLEMPIKPFTEKKLNEIKAYVSKEFDCTFWKNTFLNDAANEVMSAPLSKTLRKKVEKMEQKNKSTEAINLFVQGAQERRKSECAAKIKHDMVENVAKQLLGRGSQFSNYLLKHYPLSEWIRFDLFPADNTGNVDASARMVMQPICGFSGTPWNNTICINTNGKIKGFHDKDVAFNSSHVKELSLDIDGADIALGYILED